MSFCFEWPQFDAIFVSHAREELEKALNKGIKTSNICDKIHVKSLYMGSRPPDLDILEIGDFSEERFRGMFRLTYGGDAHVILQTKVQVNPLYATGTSEEEDGGFLGMVGAGEPLVVPLELCISQVRIRGIFLLLFSWSRGLGFTFKNDPLESVTVNSTFDALLPSVRRYLQGEIERRLGELFREELPHLVHQLTLETIKTMADRIPGPFRSGSMDFRSSRTASGGLLSTFPAIPATFRGSRSETPRPPSNQPDTLTGQDQLYYVRRGSLLRRTLAGGATDADVGEIATYTQVPIRQQVHQLYRRIISWWNNDVNSPDGGDGDAGGLRELLQSPIYQSSVYQSPPTTSIKEEGTETGIFGDLVLDNESIQSPTGAIGVAPIDMKRALRRSSLSQSLMLMRLRQICFTAFYFCPGDNSNIYYRSLPHH